MSEDFFLTTDRPPGQGYPSPMAMAKQPNGKGKDEKKSKAKQPEQSARLNPEIDLRPAALNSGKGIKMVRGGSVCDTADPGAHLVRGTRQVAVCRPTPGPDTRSRWRIPGRY